VLMLAQMSSIGWRVYRDHSLDLWARQFGLLAIVVVTSYIINGMFHDVSIILIQQFLMFFVLGLVNNIYTNQSAFQISEITISPASRSEPLQLNTAA
jgi:hypothetical protein